MKILAVLGSPRTEGNSTALARQVGQGAEAEKATVEYVYLNQLEIKPCQGCRLCQEEGAKGCVQGDDMQSLYPKIKDANALILASPVYYFNVSGQLKVFIDRCFAVGYTNTNVFSDKKLSLVLTYEDPDPFISGAINAIRWFQDFCWYVDAEEEGILYGQARETGEIKENRSLMQKAYEYGRDIVLVED